MAPPAPPIDDGVVLLRKLVQDDARPRSLLAKAPRNVHSRIAKPRRQFLAAWEAEELANIHLVLVVASQDFAGAACEAVRGCGGATPLLLSDS